MKLRAEHQVGRHLLAFADGGADWCRRCGDFDCNLRNFAGAPTACHPTPRRKRWWPQRGSRK